VETHERCRIAPSLLSVVLLAATCGGGSDDGGSPAAPTAPSAATCPSSAQTSTHYGAAGERWTPNGRLLDYAYAGYRTGTVPLPRPAGPTFDVTAYGAKADDEGDDTQAFLDAIAAAPSGVISIPAGRFVLTRRLEIRKSNLVLRGAGRDRTVLYIPVSLGAVYGLTFNDAGQSNWSFSGGFITVQGSIGGGLLASVTEAAARGDRTLKVSTTAGLSRGMWVRVLQTDSGGSLLRAFHGGRYAGDVSEDIGRQAFRFLSPIAEVGNGTVTLERPLPLEVQTAWTPELRALTASVREVGIEDLAIEFAGTRYPGHFKEEGYNAIYMNTVVDSWVRNVAIRNADYGVNVVGSFFGTVTDVVLDTTFDRGSRVGHHGLNVGGGGDHLFTRFDVRKRFIHDLTAENYSLGIVWSDGRGLDLNLDHHGRAPYGTLWTKLDLGEGTRPFDSGGSGIRMPHSAAWTTYWNVTAARDLALPPNDFGPLLTFIGMRGAASGGRTPPGDWTIEPIAAGSLCPDDLHAAMLAARPR